MTEETSRGPKNGRGAERSPSRRTARLAASIAALLLAADAPCTVVPLPPGFTETRFVAIAAPEAIAWAPDGALWIAQSYGAVGMNVFVLRNGMLRHARSLPNTQTGERGIHAIAVDPDYATNARIWVYYTADDPIRNRLSHFTNVGDALQNEVVVLEGPPVASVVHNGGCLAFGPDATVYLGMGDDALGAATSQNPRDLRGKILRVHPDGSAPADNPFQGIPGFDPRVWALGLRNPFRCSAQPGTGNLFIADVGGSLWEEIDIGVPGGNFGWPIVEGPHPPGIPGFVYPIFAYPNDQPVGAAVIGGKHVPAGRFHPDYEGNYFFADWSRSVIWRMVLDGANQPVRTEVWASSRFGPADLAFGPDGALYYAAQADSGIFRIAYTGGANRTPIARLTATPDRGPAPLAVRLDGSASSDPDGDSLAFRWEFGDGSLLDDGPAVLERTFVKGAFEATLTVDDRNGGRSSASVRIVSGNEGPIASVVSPLDRRLFMAGESVEYAGEAFDPEEGRLSCSRFAWQVLFHHAGHVHPFLGPIQGNCAGSFQTADRGEASPDTWYEIRLSVSDTGQPMGPAAALTTQHSTAIYPRLARLNLATTPRPDLRLEIDGAPFKAPRAETGVVNFIRRVGAPIEQTVDGRVYRWMAWSDGGTREHEVRIPLVDTPLVARFGCNAIETPSNLRLARDIEGSLVLTWNPVRDDCHAEGPARYRVYAAYTPRPSVPPGSFPEDPRFKLLGATESERFEYAHPEPANQFFLVVAVGSDDRDGPAGRYGSGLAGGSSPAP